MSLWNPVGVVLFRCANCSLSRIRVAGAILPEPLFVSTRYRILHATKTSFCTILPSQNIYCPECLEYLNLAAHSENTWAFVSYEKLRSDLAPTVMALLQRLGYVLSKEDAESNPVWLRLEGLLNKEQRLGYSSNHRHSVIDCCGVSREGVRHYLL